MVACVSPEKQGRATFQRRLAVSSPGGLGQPLKTGTG